MNKSGLSLCAALALALMLVFAFPAYSQDQNAKDNEDQAAPQATPGTEEIQPETPASPAAAQQQPEKKKPPVHHKQKKKKKTHKPAKKKPHHKKPVKKSKVHKKKPVKKKTAPKPQAKKEEPPPAKTEVQQAPLAPIGTAGETEKAAEEKKETTVPPVAETPRPEKKTARVEKKKPAPAVEKEAAAARAAPKPKTAASGAGKTVTYNFCLGYDNCTPYRYEAVVHGGGVDAKVFKETTDEGGWNETRVDPVMAADLGALAKSESGNDVTRALSETEKARIADHQGKVHTDLVAAAESGNTSDLKRQMSALGIKSQSDLEAYDPRLAKNETAVAAANELSTGH